MTLKIEIKTIPHTQQRYDTIGDYIDNPDGSRQILISELGNPDYEFLVAIHELIEQHLCLKRFISESSISEFDRSYRGLHRDDPGQDTNAPYHKEHMFASGIEKALCEEMGISYYKYMGVE